MRKNSAILLLLVASFVLASAAVNAATLVDPADDSKISGTSVVNATGTNLINCTFMAESSSTANSSYVDLVTIINDTANDDTIDGTFDSTILEDSDDYSFRASCYNSTDDQITTGANSGITVDNTVPNKPSSPSPSDSSLLTDSETKTFSVSVTDSETTECTYVIGRGGTSTSSQDTETGSATYSGDSCSFTKTFSDTADNGDWQWKITASDGTNTTASSKSELQVSLAPSGGGYLTTAEPTQETQEGGNAVIWIVIAIVLIAVVLYFTVGKN